MFDCRIGGIAARKFKDNPHLLTFFDNYFKKYRLTCKYIKFYILGDFIMSINILIISICSHLFILFIYFSLFLQYRQPYLKKWLAAWGINILKTSIEKYYYIDVVPPIIVSMLVVVIEVVVALLIIAGTAEFAANKLQKKWPIAALICSLLSVIMIWLEIPLQISFIPMVIYVGIAYIATGFIIGKIEAGGVPGKLTAITFIILGLQIFSIPFILPIFWTAPWSFFLDNSLKIFAALNIVFIYLEKTKSAYQLLAENGSDVIYRYQINPPIGFQYISPAAKQLTGYEVSYYKDIRQVLRIIHPEDRIKFKNFVRRLHNGKLITWRIVHKTGDVIWTEQKYSLLKDENNNAVAVEGIVRDITSRVLLEQDVARLDRLNIAGQMAASFAHEIRNPLTAIKGYLTFIGGKRELSEHKSRFDLMVTEIDRANQIITEYLSLHKDKKLDLKKTNINYIIKTLQPLLALCADHAVDQKLGGISELISDQASMRQVLLNAQPDHWGIKLNLGSIPDLLVDENEIKQVLLNLVRNALEAMPRGGNVEVETRVQDQHVVLSVKDEGNGIPTAVLDNIGKPFITTKEKGTGLGLAICYRIAERHNAKVEIGTGSKGTTISLKIPIR